MHKKFLARPSTSKEITELSTEKSALEDDIRARIAELETMSGENTALKGDIDAQKEEMTKQQRLKMEQGARVVNLSKLNDTLIDASELSKNK